jgi:hypothetical protein
MAYDLARARTMGAAQDGDEFPVLRTHINVVSGGVRVSGAGLCELVVAV